MVPYLLLFRVLINRVLRKACERYGMLLQWRVRTLMWIEEAWKLSNLDFADDVALLTSSEMEASATLARL